MASDMHAPQVLHALASLRLGHPVYLFDQIGSTNDEARRLAEGGAPEGLLVAAETQTAGRGRGGRRWLTPAGSALAFSLVLRPALRPALAGRLTMLTGIALCEAIEAVAGVHTRLKWPNDLLVNGRKAGGILVESGLLGDRLEYAVVGIGVNVSQGPAPDQVSFPATALAAEAGRPIERLKLLRASLGRMEALYARLDDAEALRAAWAARLVWLGEPVVATMAEVEVAGRAEGVADDGALLLRLNSGVVQRILAADVRLRHE